MTIQVYPNTPYKAIQWFPDVSHLVEEAVGHQIYVRGEIGRMIEDDVSSRLSHEFKSGDWLVWGEDKEGDPFMEIIPEHRFNEYYFQKTTEQ